VPEMAIALGSGSDSRPVESPSRSSPLILPSLSPISLLLITSGRMQGPFIPQQRYSTLLGPFPLRPIPSLPESVPYSRRERELDGWTPHELVDLAIWSSMTKVITACATVETLGKLPNLAQRSSASARLPNSPNAAQRAARRRDNRCR